MDLKTIIITIGGLLCVSSFGLGALFLLGSLRMAKQTDEKMRIHLEQQKRQREARPPQHLVEAKDVETVSQNDE